MMQFFSKLQKDSVLLYGLKKHYEELFFAFKFPRIYFSLLQSSDIKSSPIAVKFHRCGLSLYV